MSAKDYSCEIIIEHQNQRKKAFREIVEQLL